MGIFSKKNDDIIYEFDESRKEADVIDIDYEKNIGTIAIPSTVVKNGVKYTVSGVTSIVYNNRRKRDCSINKLILPNTVRYIGRKALTCAPIKEVVFPKNLQSIGESAFSSSDIRKVILPGGMKFIDEGAFRYCNQLESVHIEGNIEKIERGAFSECENLKVITIDGNVDCFEGSYSCEKLRSIVIKGNIGKYWPNDFPSLELFEIDGNVEELYSITHSSTKISKVLIKGRVGYIDCSMQDSELEYISIPKGVERIGCFSFKDWKKLIKADIFKDTEVIESGAFEHCKSLRDFVLPRTVKAIEEEAFVGCESLEEMTIPSSVRSVPDHLFGGCTSLKKVIIEEGVEKIGSVLFDRCYSLEQVIIPSTVKSVEVVNYVFSDDVTGLIFVKEDGTLAEGNELVGRVWRRIPQPICSKKHPKLKTIIVFTDSVKPLTEEVLNVLQDTYFPMDRAYSCD